MLHSPVLETPRLKLDPDTHRIREEIPSAPPGSLSVSDTLSANDNERSIQDQLSGRLAACQRELSLLSMYLDSEFRRRLNCQLRNLFSADEWEEGDTLPNVSSFKSFVRAMVLLEPIQRPMLALSNDGLIIAIWGENTSRLVLDFFPNDDVRWYLAHMNGEKSESTVGNTSIDRLEPIIVALDGQTLLNGEG